MNLMRTWLTRPSPQGNHLLHLTGPADGDNGSPGSNRASTKRAFRATWDRPLDLEDRQEGPRHHQALPVPRTSNRNRNFHNTPAW